MSGRMFTCFPPLLEDALFSGLHLSVLSAVAIADPDCQKSSMFQYNTEKQKQYLIEQYEKLDKKYNYLMHKINILCIYAEYSWIRAKIGIPLHYRIQYHEAIKWYQLSTWYYNETMNIVMESPHLLFMSVWLSLHPDTDHRVLQRELLLSDEAVRLIYTSLPQLIMYLESINNTKVDFPSELIPTTTQLIAQIN
jgi:hypothetical protein